MILPDGVLVWWDALPPGVPWGPQAGANGTFPCRKGRIELHSFVEEVVIIHGGKGADDVYGYEDQHYQIL